jgi:hypothetical protein
MLRISIHFFNARLEARRGGSTVEREIVVFKNVDLSAEEFVGMQAGLWFSTRCFL